jgi:hypothetical protein
MKLANTKVVIPRWQTLARNCSPLPSGLLGWRPTPPSDARTLALGARYTSGDECFHARVTVGDFMKILAKAGTVFLMPSGAARPYGYHSRKRRIHQNERIKIIRA